MRILQDVSFTARLGAADVSADAVLLFEDAAGLYIAIKETPVQSGLAVYLATK
jgi:hypothetical protein